MGSLFKVLCIEKPSSKTLPLRSYPDSPARVLGLYLVSKFRMVAWFHTVCGNLYHMISSLVSNKLLGAKEEVLPIYTFPQSS